MADLILKPGTVPVDAALPDSVQRMINMVAAYTQIDGLSGLQGVIISGTTPVTTDQDKAWIKLDTGSGRAIGIYRYLGGWQQIPVAVGTGASEPGAPVIGEIFYNTDSKALKIYTLEGWTNEFSHKGTTVKRPEGVPVGYNYFDTDISRQLRYTAQGWSTVDGAIGTIAMFSGLTTSEAELRNPGWYIWQELAGRFPMGYSEGSVALGSLGGRESFSFSGSAGKTNGQSGGELAMNGLSIDAKQIGGTGALVSYSGATTSFNGTVNTVPPYLAVIYMRKSY
jgi:hypothetical protein